MLTFWLWYWSGEGSMVGSGAGKALFPDAIPCRNVLTRSTRVFCMADTWPSNDRIRLPSTTDQHSGRLTLRLHRHLLIALAFPSHTPTQHSGIVCMVDLLLRHIASSSFYNYSVRQPKSNVNRGSFEGLHKLLHISAHDSDMQVSTYDLPD